MTGLAVRMVSPNRERALSLASAAPPPTAEIKSNRLT